jgi:hypothetical protein
MIRVHDCCATLWGICRQFEGSGIVSFEGDLKRFGLEELPGSSHQETDSIKRQTQWPEMDFVVVPITASNLLVLQSRIEERDLLGWEGSITHVHIESGGQLALAACDNFHEDATAVTPLVSDSILAQLQSAGAVRAIVTPYTSFERTREG